jgi:hypothetical protein
MTNGRLRTTVRPTEVTTHEKLSEKRRLAIGEAKAMEPSEDWIFEFQREREDGEFEDTMRR